MIAEIEKELPCLHSSLNGKHFKDKGKFVRLSLTYLEMVVPAGAAVVSAAYILYWSAASSVSYCNDMAATTPLRFPSINFFRDSHFHS